MFLLPFASPAVVIGSHKAEVSMGARENIKLDLPDLGYIRMPFMEKEGRKIPPPKQNLAVGQ